MLLQNALVSASDLGLLLLKSITGERVHFCLNLRTIFLDPAETLLLHLLDLVQRLRVLNGLLAAALRRELFLMATTWTVARCVAFRPVVGEKLFWDVVAHELSVVGGKESVCIRGNSNS